MMLDLSGRVAVIVGGGAVGARKARGVVDAGATVRCVSPTFCEQMPATVQRIVGRYQSTHLDGAALVFAATDQPEVNSEIVRDARNRSIPVCRADLDETDPGDFSTPAMHVQGDLVITVSAGSPALSALIRNRLESAIDPAWAQMARAMQELRPRVKSLGIPVENRRQIFRDLATDAAIDVLRKGGLDGLKLWLASRYPELNHA
jgi:precorrin-2 dehydrogenase/sirohydrochlorin ferrochelatase